MKNNIILKILLSIPIILIALYFIPFLGVCLIIFKLFVYGSKKSIITSVSLLIVGLLVLIPKVLSLTKINIDKIESRFGTDYRMTSKHNLAYNCPFCEEKRGKADTDHKCMVDAKTTLYYCFKCHTSGPVTLNTLYVSPTFTSIKLPSANPWNSPVVELFVSSGLLEVFFSSSF